MHVIANLILLRYLARRVFRWKWIRYFPSYWPRTRVTNVLHVGVLPILQVFVSMHRWHYVYSCPSVPASVLRLVLSVFLSLRKNTDRISMGDNHYHEQIKWFHFGRNRNKNKETGYERQFDSTSVGLAAMSNRCWHLANEFTNSLHRLRKMRSRTQFHVNLKTSLTNFI